MVYDFLSSRICDVNPEYKGTHPYYSRISSVNIISKKSHTSC